MQSKGSLSLICFLFLKESKREEKLTKVEEQVKKEQEDAQNEKKELFEARRNKQDELRKLEFKIDMTELVSICICVEKDNTNV